MKCIPIAEKWYHSYFDDFDVCIPGLDQSQEVDEAGQPDSLCTISDVIEMFE